MASVWEKVRGHYSLFGITNISNWVLIFLIFSLTFVINLALPTCSQQAEG